jgi:hypothetical protein
MNKLILSSLAAAAALAVPTASHAQGVVNLSSSGGGSCITSNTVTGATAKIAAGGYTFGLYVASSAAGLPTAASPSGTPALTLVNSGFAGIISGSSFTIAGLTAGTTYFDEVVGWSGSALSYASFLSGGPGASSAAGFSAIGSITPVAVGSTSPAPFVFGNPASTPGAVLTPTLLTPVPEPSTIALAGLGIAGLVAIRRRK